MTSFAQQAHGFNADVGADETAGQHHDAHFYIDVVAPELGDCTRDRRGDDVCCAGADRNGRRYAEKNKQRRQQKSAADAEQP